MSSSIQRAIICRMTNTFFKTIHTIAIVGLSDKQDRPSYKVAEYLHSNGFTIIPINPFISSWNTLSSYKTLAEVPNNIHIDVVNIFRKGQFVYPIVVAAVKREDVKIIWMQEGVKNDGAKEYAQHHGLQVVMNSCIMKAHKKTTYDHFSQ